VPKIDDLIKHDRYVESLCAQIDPHYDLVLKHVPLFSTRKTSRKKRMVGEIDILAMKGNYYDLYEVKCSHRIIKAKKQLGRIMRTIHLDKKLRNVYFFCGESGRLESLKEEKQQSENEQK